MVPRFRKASVWSLRLDDVIRYRSPNGRIHGRVIELDLVPEHGEVVGAVLDRNGRTRQFRFTDSDKVWRRLVPLGGMLADLDQPPEPERPIKGYQVKVGRERDPYWLHRAGDGYEVKQDMPVDPPFLGLEEAHCASLWVSQMSPESATLIQPVYQPLGHDPALSDQGDSARQL